ncbi:MAG: hypothetical protein Q9220_004125 [cf. Caloplaca sp. 1 TL-2023]
MPLPPIRQGTEMGKQLSPSVFLSEPARDGAITKTASSQEKSNASSRHQDTRSMPVQSSHLAPPTVIILFTWMSAHPQHISKYIDGYQAQYPDSPIVIVRSTPPDLFYRTIRAQRQRVSPAVSYLLSLLPSSGDDEHPDGSTAPQLILHVFSNGGSHQLCNFLQAYRTTTTLPFPPHIKIFDSCPGRAQFQRSVLALAVGVPRVQPVRFVMTCLIYIVISLYWFILVPLRITDPIERIRRSLLDEKLMQGELRRCYVYSEADAMVGWRDVEDSAREAVRKGFRVRSEKFEGSGHCAHIKVKGGEPYWQLVGEVWQDKID